MFPGRPREFANLPFRDLFPTRAAWITDHDVAARVAAYTPGTTPPAITDDDDDGQVVIDLTDHTKDRQP